LRECDPAPELLDLDTPYRAAAARVKNARGDFDGVLSLLGRREDDVPLQPSLRLPLAALRVHALESLGQLDEAWSVFCVARAAHGDDAMRAALAAGALAPRTRERDGRAELDVLAQERADVTTGVRTLAAPLATLPALALAGLLVVT